MVDLLVRDLLSGDCWNASLIEALFDEYTCRRILSTPILPRDQISWSSYVDSTRVCKSIYSSFFDLNFDWDWVWHSNLLPKCKLFTWRLGNSSLPTNSKLARFGLRPSNLCSWGCDSSDSPNHISSQCIFTQCVWAAISSLGFSPSKPSNLVDLLTLAKAKKSLSFETSLTILAAYQAWNAKNTLDHTGKFTTPLNCAFSILNSVISATSLTNQMSWGDFRPSRTSHLLWHPPPFGWLKFNFDGSFTDKNHASIGVICRDSSGRVISGCCGPVIATSPSHCEVLAGHSISLLVEDWMVELNGIIIEGDCQLALSILARDFRRSSADTGHDGIGLLHKFRTVLFSSCCRFDNRLADACSRIGRDRWVFFRGSEVPCQILSLVEEEIPS